MKSIDEAITFYKKLLLDSTEYLTKYESRGTSLDKSILIRVGEQIYLYKCFIKTLESLKQT